MSKLEKFETALYGILRTIDADLESRYGSLYPLHPARPEAGETANPQYDGLFRVTASFSAGFGSQFGSGYIFRVEFVTLQNVPGDVRTKIESEAVELLKKELVRVFPDRELSVSRDGAALKIYGDLSLR